MGAQSQVMLASVRGYWAQAESYQKFLYFIGFLLLVSAVFHTGVFIVTGGSLEGDISWRKPILFGESFGLTCLSVAWIMTFLPKWCVWGWLLAGALGLANFGEVFLVAMQQWRGVPSHFNSSTPFDAAVFFLMAILIMFAGIVILMVTHPADLLRPGGTPWPHLGHPGRHAPVGHGPGSRNSDDPP